MKAILKILLFIIYMTQSIITVAQNTYYVDVNVTNDNGNGSINNPKKHIQSAIDLMSTTGGDTVIIKSGIYSNINDAIIDPPSGTSSNYNVIKAEVDGTVIISGVRDHPLNSYYTDNNLYFSSSQYIQFEGLHFKGKGNKGGDGSYIKFFRTSFDDGPDGNAYVFSSGGSYLLLEDCFFYGPGGRQALAFYEADHIIVRRAVVRHDIGWKRIDKDEPTGVATIYNSNYVEFQNVILIDSFEDPNPVGSNEWAGGVSFATNGPANIENNVRGLISINVQGTGHAYGGYSDIGPVNFYDEVGYIDPALPYQAYGVVSMNNGGGNVKSGNVERATIVNYQTLAALYGGPSFVANIKNTIGYNIGTPFVADSGNTITESYNNCYPTASSGSGSVTTDPTQNGLLYLPRIESGSLLSTAGENGGQIGANVVNRIGVSGTLHGETGYNTETSESLWPYPYEDRIKQEMGANMGVTRGFCASGNGLYGGLITLTSYIWEALGNPCPADICGVLSTNKDHLYNAFLLKPNPTSNTFTFEIKNDVLHKLVICNQIGQQVKEATSNEVDVSDLPSGIYLVKFLMKSGGTFSKKLIKN